MSSEVIVAIVAAAISLIAVVISLISLSNSRKASQVSMELLIQQLICGARKDTHEFSYKISDGDKGIATKLLNSYIEQELNTYDVACAAYIDKKIDRKRFKKTYFTEIQNLFKGKATKALLDEHGRYSVIKKVYKEWFNLEK
jgi:hypothetical protein